MYQNFQLHRIATIDVGSPLLRNEDLTIYVETHGVLKDVEFPSATNRSNIPLVKFGDLPVISTFATKGNVWIKNTTREAVCLRYKNGLPMDGDVISKRRQRFKTNAPVQPLCTTMVIENARTEE